MFKPFYSILLILGFWSCNDDKSKWRLTLNNDFGEIEIILPNVYDTSISWVDISYKTDIDTCGLQIYQFENKSIYHKQNPSINFYQITISHPVYIKTDVSNLFTKELADSISECRYKKHTAFSSGNYFATTFEKINNYNFLIIESQSSIIVKNLGEDQYHNEYFSEVEAITYIDGIEFCIQFLLQGKYSSIEYIDESKEALKTIKINHELISLFQ